MLEICKNLYLKKKNQKNILANSISFVYVYKY